MDQNIESSPAHASALTSLLFHQSDNKQSNDNDNDHINNKHDDNHHLTRQSQRRRRHTSLPLSLSLLLLGKIMSTYICSTDVSVGAFTGVGVNAFMIDVKDSGSISMIRPISLIQTSKHESSIGYGKSRYRHDVQGNIHTHTHTHTHTHGRQRQRQRQQQIFELQMSAGGTNANAGDGGDEDERRSKKDFIENSNSDANDRTDQQQLNGNHDDVKKLTLQSQTQTEKNDDNNGDATTDMSIELKLQNEELAHRITQLESLAGSQAVELRKLREECDSLKDAALAFSQVVELLRQAGLTVDQVSQSKEKDSTTGKSSTKSNTAKDSSRNDTSKGSNAKAKSKSNSSKEETTIYEHVDEAEIFGSAPASVSDAADTAGASILAAILGGKQRMLVDVRDAELSRDPDVLVQFIELAILPVAAGLEGLKTQKNRVKIVFPTVSQLMQYRKTMALAAPEVVSLSTLGFDPVEKRDNLVVIIAPSPDDEEGLLQMNELLSSDSIRQPVVVFNHHMVPLTGPGGEFEPIYHLRLLTVQYMAGDTSPGSIESKNSNRGGKAQTLSSSNDPQQQQQLKTNVTEEVLGSSNTNSSNVNATGTTNLSPEKEDAALAAAMEHAHELGIHQGVTRAMVIRAYPRPWHVFVDTSPDTDADFEVAATFDEYPSQDDINYAIVECLEGSEREDELVAQQMQEAIESGQLNSISDMLGLTNMDNKLGSEDGDEDGEDDDDDDFYNDWDPWYGADTV